MRYGGRKRDLEFGWDLVFDLCCCDLKLDKSEVVHEFKEKKRMVSCEKHDSRICA